MPFGSALILYIEAFYKQFNLVTAFKAAFNYKTSLLQSTPQLSTSLKHCAQAYNVRQFDPSWSDGLKAFDEKVALIKVNLLDTL